MTKLIIFTGTPGSGKSTVLAELAKNGVKVVNLGSEMLKVAQRKGVTDRDKLRYMSDDDIIETRVEALKGIIEAKEDTIIDTHATVKQGSRYVPGLSITELTNIRIKAVVYIDATSKEVLRRRQNDTTRKREQETEGDIDEQRSVNIAIISAFALHYNIPIYIIDNKEDRVADTVNEISKIVAELFSGE
jgi:adenylate kinase